MKNILFIKKKKKNNRFFHLKLENLLQLLPSSGLLFEKNLKTSCVKRTLKKIDNSRAKFS